MVKTVHLQIQKSKISIKKKILPSLILSFVVFLGSGNILFAQADTSDIQAKYIDILEKTNQQLSFYWNPYNTILAFLTALFAIFAIIFGWMIYSQSREYKEKLAEDKRRYERKITDFLEQQQKYANKRIEKIEASFNQIISEYEKKLKELSKTPKRQRHKIEEIEKAIEKLKTEKELLKSRVEPIAVTPDYNYLSGVGSIIGGVRLHKCSHCGFTFKIKLDPLSAYATIGSATVTCPKCGNIDSI